MASFLKIDSIWIDFSQYDLKDPHQCEPSTTRGNVSEQNPPLPPSEGLNDHIGCNRSKSNDNENGNNSQVVRRTENEIILENICNDQISSVPSKKNSPADEEDEPKKTRLLADIIKELDSDKKTCHPNEVVVQISTTKKNIRSKGRKSKSRVDKWCQHVENVVPKIKEDPKKNLKSIKKTNLVGGIVICEPKKNEMAGMKNVPINNNDDEANIIDKGKGRMIQTNEKSDSSSSWEEEDLAFASHSQLFPYDALRFGEGASKFFQDETDSRPQLNIREGIEENSLEDFHIPPYNVQEKNVCTKEKGCGGDVDDIAMHEVTKTFKDKLPNVGNENGLMGHSILFEATRAVGEDKKFEKRSRKSRTQKKRDTKRRK